MTEIENMALLTNKRLKRRGFAYSLSQTFPYLGFALTLCYGGFLVAENDIAYQDVIKFVEIFSLKMCHNLLICVNLRSEKR